MSDCLVSCEGVALLTGNKSVEMINVAAYVNSSPPQPPGDLTNWIKDMDLNYKTNSPDP